MRTQCTHCSSISDGSTLFLSSTTPCPLHILVAWKEDSQIQCSLCGASAFRYFRGGALRLRAGQSRSQGRHCLPDVASYNRGQNSLGQMFFALKEAFPVCKLLPFTANAPLPPIAMLVAERRHTCQLIYEIFISFQHCNGGWGGGISTQNFLQNTKCIMSFVRDCSPWNQVACWLDPVKIRWYKGL